jgi:4-carboxymuconolactone decarboxylase
VERYPEWFLYLQGKYPLLMEAVETLGKTTHNSGPLDAKTAQLVQLAAAISIRSQGAVHSHAKRAKLAGAKNDEIEHAAILLTSTIGFPSVAAALSWIDEVIGDK